MSVIFGEMRTFDQENGPEVQLRVYGDEFCSRHEEPTGFTVVYDVSRGLFCYAALKGNRLESTGVPLAETPPPGLARHLQESVIERRARTERRRLLRMPPTVGARAGLMRDFAPNNGLLDGTQLKNGAVRGLTILVEFSDVTSTVTKADVEEALNGTNYTRNGNICSVREYFLRVSNGKLDYTNVVVGPFRLSHKRSYYVQNLVVPEALQLALAAGVDMSQFDSLGRGIVDALNVLYAGQTQYLGELWPHNFYIDLPAGPLRTELYMLTSVGRTPEDLTIGTFCHETGHLLCRFPDLYDYGQRDGDNVRSAGLGVYCLMGSGNHLGSGRSPSPVCGYLRYLAGWCDKVQNLTTPGDFEARPGDYGTVFRYPSSKANEFFILENRVKTGLDRELPASGLAVYHCDILGSNEHQEGTAAEHYQCALLQADGHRDLELNVNQGDGSDLFGTTAGIALSGASSPATREWDGRDSGLVISDIQIDEETIKFKAGQTAVPRTVSASATPMLAIPDNQRSGIASTLSIGDSGIVSRIKVSINIAHTWIGDLRIELSAPGGRRALLHGRRGGSQDDLVATYDSASPGVLTSLIGQPIQGDWVLRVSDLAEGDVGTLRSWGLEITSATVGAVSPLVTAASAA